MATDANILMGIKPMQTKDPMELYEAGQRIESNRLTGLMNTMKMDEYKRGVTDQNTLRDVYRQFGTDSTANAKALYGAGLGKQAGEYAKAQGDLAKDAASTGKTRLEAAGIAMTQHRDSVNFIKSQDDIKLWLKAGFDNPDLRPMFASRGTLEQQVQTIDAQVISPKQIDDWKLLASTNTKELLAQLSPDANARLTAKTSTDNNTANNLQSGLNNAATVGNSAANAELGDKRARDLNAIKQADVTLKREAKDEAAKLTKDSQLASFDTMLGTLGRLSEHKGLSRSVGITGAFPTMPGSDSANFQAELNTFQSQAFIPMVAQLKGMGALSDAEGKKLTAAVGALDPKMGEVEFRASVDRITTDMQAARARVVGVPKTTGAVVKDKAAYDALPSGATFTAPDGTTRRKP